MKSQKQEPKFAQSQHKAKQPRFKIEKLEERIAPKKGGIPGPPDDHNPPGLCRKTRSGC